MNKLKIIRDTLKHTGMLFGVFVYVSSITVALIVATTLISNAVDSGNMFKTALFSLGYFLVLSAQIGFAIAVLSDIINSKK